MELDTLSIRVFVVIQELGYLLEYYTCHTSTRSRNFLALSLYLHQQESQIGVGHGVYSSGLLDFHNPYNGTYYAVCVPPNIKTNLIVAQFTNSAVIIFVTAIIQIYSNLCKQINQQTCYWVCNEAACNCSSHLKQLFVHRLYILNVQLQDPHLLRICYCPTLDKSQNHIRLKATCLHC